MNLLRMLLFILRSDGPQAPSGYVFLVDPDGAYLIDPDGAYLIEAA